ncbi:MAG TPA: chemotaxis protein CheB [Thermoanaerobaculia bacterium]|nr:chemotaxis protein CheB [Thermoanaerobaculia bacterium]
MRNQRIVVIGASAGGVEALSIVVRDLPESLAAPVCIVLHIPFDAPTLLPTILNRRTELEVVAATDGAKLKNGTIYVAQPDRHLIVANGFLRLTRGPRENRHRPAVDAMFRSAALAYGSGVVGVVLTGSLDDGTAGLQAIKQRGGIAIVQDPRDALYASMPQSAIENVGVDTVVPLAEVGGAITAAIAAPAPKRRTSPHDAELEMEKRIAEMDEDAMTTDERPGRPSPYSCPDCGGVLWELSQEGYVRYRCRVGHALSPEALLGAHQEKVEEALWSALKTLDERARLSGRLAVAEREKGHDWMARRFDEQEDDARKRAEVIRQFLMSGQTAQPLHMPPTDGDSRSVD